MQLHVKFQVYRASSFFNMNFRNLKILGQSRGGGGGGGGGSPHKQKQ